MAERSVSSGWKVVYYTGMTLVVMGFLSCGSVFISGTMYFIDYSYYYRTQYMIMRAIIGVGLMILGSVLANMGSPGLAGFGLRFGLRRARKDVEPGSRMPGGIVKDVIEEAGMQIGSIQTDDKDSQDFDLKLRKLYNLYEEGVLSEEEYRKEMLEMLDNVRDKP